MSHVSSGLDACQCLSLAHRYPSARGDVLALQDFNLNLPRGELVSLLGPSGCGKSTLLRLLSGLQRPSSGTITFPGWDKPPRIRVVFQEHGLFPWMTVADNAGFGLEMEGVPKRERRARVLEVLELLGLAGFSNHYPRELSGGMRQRVAIARAFVVEPDILLMDEPFRALDAPMRRLLQEELERLWLDRKPTILFVTHDIEEAVLLGDRVVMMAGRPGKVLEEFRLDFGRPRTSTPPEPLEKEGLKAKLWNLLKPEVLMQDA